MEYPLLGTPVGLGIARGPIADGVELAATVGGDDLRVFCERFPKDGSAGGSFGAQCTLPTSGKLGVHAPDKQ